MDYTVIDFETCNPKRESACAVGLVTVSNGKIVDEFETLIRPERLEFHEGTMSVHGLDENAIRDAPPIREVWPEIERRIDGRIVFAHWARFDISVLRYSLHAAGIQSCSFDYFCSVALAQLAWPELPLHRLDYLCSTFDIELEHHDALSDSRACAKIVNQAANSLGIDDFASVEDGWIRRGRVFSTEFWEPPSTPRFESTRHHFTVELPDGFVLASHPLNLKHVCVTGKLAFCTRDCAFAAIETFGGIPQKSVTKVTQVLVIGDVDARTLAVGESLSSKHRKALEYREKRKQMIEFLDEQTFLKILQEPNDE